MLRLQPEAAPEPPALDGSQRRPRGTLSMNAGPDTAQRALGKSFGFAAATLDNADYAGARTASDPAVTITAAQHSGGVLNTSADNKRGRK
jgi:hypothetical protein